MDQGSVDTKKARKNLIFLPAEFPFGAGETFIENELPFLARAFEKIFILIPAKVAYKPQRQTPQNLTTILIEKNLPWVQRVSVLANLSFWQALKLDLKRRNRRTGFFNVFRIGWHYFTQGLLVKKTIQNLMTQYKINPEETILYSYWLDEKAVGIALVKKKHLEIMTFSRAHGWDVYEERHQPPFLPFRPWLFKTLDKVAVVSKKGAHYLNEKFDPLEGKVVVSYLGTNPINEKCKIKNEKFSIVSCSNLIALKRAHLIIEALALLDQSVSWTHIGDGSLREELENMSARLFEGKNIEFSFTGQLTNKQVRKIYEIRHFDLFISTSETEGLPVSMMEAQSAGIPILATNVGGVNEIVLHEKTGWLLPENPSPEEVAKKMAEIMSLPEKEILNVRKHAFFHWKMNFYAEKNYPEFVKILKVS